MSYSPAATPGIVVLILFELVMAKLGGAPSLAILELTTQKAYFAFLVIQVFLVVTVASSATRAIGELIDHPMSVATLLARTFPKASNFYISYIILQGLSFSSSALLQIRRLVGHRILSKIIDSTPRKLYTRCSSLPQLLWGTIYPTPSLLAVVGE